MAVTKTIKKTEEKPKLSYSEAFTQEQIKAGKYFYGPGSYLVGNKVVEYVPGEKPGVGYVRVGDKWVKATEVKIKHLPPARTYRKSKPKEKLKPEEKPEEKKINLTKEEPIKQTKKDLPIKKDVPSVEYYYGLYGGDRGVWKGEFTTTEELKRRGEYYTERPFVPIGGPVGAVGSGFVSMFVPSFEVPLYESVPTEGLIKSGYKFKPTTEPLPTRKVGTMKIGKSEESMTGTEKEYYKIGKGIGAAANIRLLTGAPIEKTSYELAGAETKYIGAAAKTKEGTKAEVSAFTRLKYKEFEWGEPTGGFKFEFVPSYSKLTTKPITKKTTKTIGEISFKPPFSEEVKTTEIIGYSTKTGFKAPRVRISEGEINLGYSDLFYDISKTSTTSKELKEGTRTFYEGMSFKAVEGEKGFFGVGAGRIKKVSKQGIEKEVKTKSTGIIRNVELSESIGLKPRKTTKTNKNIIASEMDTSFITPSTIKEAPLEIEESSLRMPFVSSGELKTSEKPISLVKEMPVFISISKSSSKERGILGPKTGISTKTSIKTKKETKKKIIIKPIQTELFKQKERKGVISLLETKSLFKQKEKQKKAISPLSKLLEKTGQSSKKSTTKPPSTPFGFGGFGFGFNLPFKPPKVKLPSGGGFSLFKRRSKRKKKSVKKSYAPDLFSVFVGRKKKGKPKKKIFTGFEFRPIFLTKKTKKTNKKTKKR